MKNIRKIVKSIRDCSENTQVLLYGIINRDDGNHNDKISEMNNRMASYSEGQGLIFINNNNNNNNNNKNTNNNNDDDHHNNNNNNNNNNDNNNDNDNKAKIEKSQGDSLCRVCRKVDESIDHNVSGCSKLAQKEYNGKHDNLGKIVHWKLARKGNFEAGDK